MLSATHIVIEYIERLKRGLQGVKSRRGHVKAHDVNYVKERKPLSVREERDIELYVGKNKEC